VFLNILLLFVFCTPISDKHVWLYWQKVADELNRSLESSISVWTDGEGSIRRLVEVEFLANNEFILSNRIELRMVRMF
jgi:hypothetical protein